MRIARLTKGIFLLMILLAVLVGCSESSTGGDSPSSEDASKATTGTAKAPETAGSTASKSPGMTSPTTVESGKTSASGETAATGQYANTEEQVSETPNQDRGQAREQDQGQAREQDQERAQEQDQEQARGQAQEGGLQVSDTLVPGAVDTTGGPLAQNRMVSFYGHPYSAAMGVLGQYEPQRMVSLLKEQAAAYTEIDPDRPAICTIELIASVAQPTPGADGLYLNRTPPEVIEQYATLAKDNDCLLLLDVQIGYSTIADEVEVLLPYLKRPYVHLAIDPEYDMAPGEIPGQQFGASYASEIMGAAQTLSDLVDRNEDLQAKVLVIHQFRYDMIINKEVLEPVKNVEMAIHADGFGGPQVKYEKYNALVAQQPIQYGGFKLFYDQDTPLLTPNQVLSDLNPPPAVISYQ